MTETDDNRMLEQFFEPARRLEIADAGFSDRVMDRLPDKAIRLSHWWTASCVAVALVLFVVFRGWEPLLLGLWGMTRTLLTHVHPVPFFMTVGVLSCLALLELVHRQERMPL